MKCVLNDSIGSKKFLTPAETAEILGVTVGTLNVWRSTGRHDLPYFLLARRVKYRLEDVQNFIQKSINSTLSSNK